MQGSRVSLQDGWPGSLAAGQGGSKVIPTCFVTASHTYRGCEMNLIWFGAST